MNLTPSTVRADLKCGNGSISEGEKCSKGSAQKVQGKGGGKAGGRLKTLAKVAGAAALIGGAAYMANTAGKAAMAARTSTKEGRFMQRVGNKVATAQAAQANNARFQKIKQSQGKALLSNVMNKQAKVWGKAMGKRDSVWAQGFEP